MVPRTAPGAAALACLVVAVGCRSADDVADRGDRASQTCSHHIDELIDDGVVPRADRDYATGMCERQH